MKIDWKRKLTSRKLWMALAGVITGLVIFINSPDKSSPDAITSLVMAFGSFVAYIIGEGLADSGAKDSNVPGKTEDNNGTDN